MEESGESIDGKVNGHNGGLSQFQLEIRELCFKGLFTHLNRREPSIEEMEVYRQKLFQNDAGSNSHGPQWPNGYRNIHYFLCKTKNAWSF